MSQEKIDTLRAFYEAFNRRDFDAALQYMDPEVEIHPGVAGADVSSVYRGRDGVRRFFKTVTKGLEVTVELKEIIEASDDDRVRMVVRWQNQGRHGIELDFEFTDVYSFRDGLIVRGDGFVDKAGAVEAVGPRE
jgi:ketosteroid isomerase-like protein